MRVLPVVLLAALGAWHMALRGHGRGLPLITDEGEYFVAARAWAQGGLPYRDAFSQKPPNVFLFYRAAQAASDEVDAPRRVAEFFSLGVMAALFLASPPSWSLAARLAGPGAYAGLSTLPLGDLGFPANTEAFLNLFTALGALAIVRGSPLLAGIAGGAALMTKQTALWVVLGFGAIAARRGGRWTGRGAVLYAAGAALVPAAWLVYFWLAGGLGDFWDCAFAGNGRYAAVLMMTGTLGSQVGWFLTALLPRLALFAAPALALAVWGGRGLKAGDRNPVETLAVVWFGAAFAGALTGLFLFPHYFLQAAPGLCLAAACGVERLRRDRGVRSAAVAACCLSLWPALMAPRLYFAAGPEESAVRLLHPNPLLEARVLGSEIRRRSRPGDRLHVFGSEGALFAYAGLAPATRHTLCYALTLFPAGSSDIDAEMETLKRSPPRFVVWSTQPLSTMISSTIGLSYRDRLAAFLADGYRWTGRVAVAGGPPAPAFEPAAAGSRPDFGTDGQLLLFESRTPGGRDASR
ncbi:MAG: hypothetical protein HY927_05445 [Elusimicrobia bacterium]|nr:hypothetical protein [Elusimicrobiota bacterium]